MTNFTPIDGPRDDAEATGLSELRSGPVLVTLADVQPERVQWLWSGRFALGKLTLLAGDPGLGKSLITLDMAARVSAGRPWPDGAEASAPGGVVLLTAEDDLVPFPVSDYRAGSAL